MNGLIKTAIKTAATIAVAVGVGYLWDKYSGQNQKLTPAGTLDASGKPSISGIAKLSGVAALGALVLGFIAKKLKLNILK